MVLQWDMNTVNANVNGRWFLVTY